MGTSKEKAIKITAKQIGRNIIINISGKQYSKKTVDGDEVSSIKRKLDLYAKNPTENNLNKITNIFEKQDKKALVKKGLKTAIKKETKKGKAIASVIDSVHSTKEKEELISKNLELSKRIDELEAKLADKEKTENVKPQETPRPRRLEY